MTFPLGQDKDAVRDGQHLRKLRRDKQHRETLLSEPVHNLENLSLGSHINAAGRFIQEQDVWLSQQALGEDHLLLVAAAQRSDRILRAAGLDRQVLHELDDGFPFPCVH